MACSNPLTGYRPKGGGRLVYDRRLAPEGAVEVVHGCGKCILCRTTFARHMQIRLIHEAKLHERKCLVTLTYSPEHCPLDGGLVKRHAQLFLHRLRKHLWRAYKVRVRFLLVGEYGEQRGRPHYHAVIFGWDFPDAKRARKGIQEKSDGKECRLSPLLDKLWGYGATTVQDADNGGMAYVSRYVTKKWTGPAAERRHGAPYQHPVTQEWMTSPIPPEFMICSRRPGIGSGWFDRFACDVFPSDFVIVDGEKSSVPRYYLNKLRKRDQLTMKHRRRAKASTPEAKANSTPDRLAVRERIRQIKASEARGRL